MSSKTPYHCWVCDDHGGLYILSDHPQKWVKVDSGFKSIYGGYGGLVCGIKDCSLYIRKCVNHKTPVGTGWVVYACDILKVMPGRTCIVRKSSKGCLLAARVDLEAEVLDWKPIQPHCTEVGERSSEQLHHVMDDGDRLFTVTGRGAVYCCEPLTRDLYWYPIAAPPNIGSSQGIFGKLFSSFWSANGDTNSGQDWVSMISFGTGCIWCLREDTVEVWQLVIAWLNSAPKSNWARVELPLAEKEVVVSLSAFKSAMGGMYAIVKGEGYFKMVSCSSGSAAGGPGRVEIGLPVRTPCWSMAICSTQTAPGNEVHYQWLLCFSHQQW